MNLLGKPFLFGCLTGAFLFLIYFNIVSQKQEVSDFKHLEIEVVNY